MSNVFDMKGNVVPLVLPEGTLADVPVERVLDGAKNCTEVMVIGWDENGEFFLAASTGQSGGHLLLLELAKDDIMSRHR